MSKYDDPDLNADEVAYGQQVTGGIFTAAICTSAALAFGAVAGLSNLIGLDTLSGIFKFATALAGAGALFGAYNIAAGQIRLNALDSQKESKHYQP